ncbi:hypothetical protein NMG60_11011854 [Bertholletia excelsa]
MVQNDKHFLDNAIPAEIMENLNVFFPEFGDLNHEEVLQHQDSIYQSLRGSDEDNGMRSHPGQSSDWNQFSGQSGESSRDRSFQLRLALDEDLARSLQLEDEFDDLNISQSTNSAMENREVNPRDTPSMSVNPNIREDNVDPDNMTYEQLQLLGESIGSENRGLSEELISRLPNFKYRKGIFSRQKEKHECVICYTNFRNREKLIILPCAHQYHSECIAQWLRLNKLCPICQKEVSDE